MSKSILQIISSCFVQKTAPKKAKHSRNESILKIGHHACKRYSPCKIPTLAKKLKFQKTCQNPFYKLLGVVLCKKTAPKNTKYWRNESILKIGHHACKGYSPCKILTFAQKLKFQKTFKSILQIIFSRSEKQTAPKNTKYSRNESILKIGHHACKGYSPCKILTLDQKLKFQKTCQNPFYKSFRVVLCKKTAPKNTKYSRNESILKIHHHACKSYSLCKILTFAKKLKFRKTSQNPFYKSFLVVL